MSDNPNGEVPDFLRGQFARIHSRFDRVDADLSDAKRRLTAVETPVAMLRGDFAGQSARIDRIELRLDRIERRLDLVSAA